MAGLFHDIGILIYDQFFHEEFAKIVDLALAKSITFLEAEETLAPRETHGMLGAALLETWRIPLNVIDPIRFHHSPLRAPQNHVIPVTIMALTEHLLANAGVSSFEGNPGRINPQYWEILGISSKQEESLTLLAKLEADKSDVVMFFDKSPGLASSGSATLLRTV